MTDLASQKRLTRSAPNLPLSWYFDPQVAQLEQKLLFARGPGYVAHERMAPNPGDYRVLDWRSNGAWTLVNNDGRHDLVSNVCRHRQAIMLKGAGHLPGGTITCPLHRWSYDGEGKPPVTDGPFAETKDLIAGWMVIDVDTQERALELAAELSAAPGAGGQPIHEWLEVRPFMGEQRHLFED